MMSILVAGILNVIPRPVESHLEPGHFELRPGATIQGDPTEAVTLQRYLHEATGLDFPMESHGTIRLRLQPDAQLGTEGYRLQITPNGIDLTAPTPAGLFYGIQTIRQLLPLTAPWQLPAVEITDYPRFKWRGLMIDVSRHFFGVDFIKKQLDLMALQKLNVFHWHLTDDQGWRIEIKRYPKLTEIGSKRGAIGTNEPPESGFYTQEQIREVVAYAKERFITVVPEIDVPGHSEAALASYPELGCTGGPYKVATKWGPQDDVLCAGNEGTYVFLTNVLTEVMALFPGQYIHLGGDECRKVRWKECPKCQARIKAEGLDGEKGLQSWFIHRLNAFLNAHGRRLIGWDEIVDGGLAPGATVMYWRTWTTAGLQAARLGHDMVMTPSTDCYLDYYQAEDHTKEPRALNHTVTLGRVYSFEPRLKELDPQDYRHILGLQGCLWTDVYIRTPEYAEYMLYPRLTALAEIAWSPPGARDFTEFKQRLAVFLERLRSLGVNYRPLDKSVKSQLIPHSPLTSPTASSPQKS